MRSRIIRGVFYHEDKKYDDFASYEEADKYYSDLWNQAVIAFNDPTSWPKIKEYINKLAIRAIESFQKSFALVSFCAEGNSQIMWSHYASDSTGFALVFDYPWLVEAVADWISKKYSSLSPMGRSILGFHAVVYSNVFPDGTDYLYHLIMKNKDFSFVENPYLDGVHTDSDVQFLLSLLIQKREEWSYEKEFRLVLPFGGLFSDESNFNDLNEISGFSSQNIYYFNIGNISPWGICLGEKMSLINRMALAAFAKTYGISLFLQDFSLLPSAGYIEAKPLNPDEILKTIAK